MFVTGYSTRARSGTDYTTIAYNAATGAQLWIKRHSGSARSVATSPTRGTVFVTGTSNGATFGGDYTTIAYKD